MSCPVTSDVTLTTRQTHMHKQGLGGAANLEDSAGSVLQQLYTSNTWSDPTVTQWPHRAWRCSRVSRSTTSATTRTTATTTIIQGLSAQTNEMCVLVGAYYPRDTKFETCGTTGSFQDQGTAATYIGTGTATCTATLGCLQGATTEESFFSCMVDSCPAAAAALTKFLDCANTVPNGGNVMTMCSSQISACIAQGC